MDNVSLEELIEELKRRKVVFTDVQYGDFEVGEVTGARLSEDNFVNDFRPIVRLKKRRD